MLLHLLGLYLVLGLVWLVSDHVLALAGSIVDLVKGVLLNVLDLAKLVIGLVVGLVKDHASSKDAVLASLKSVVLWPVAMVHALFKK